MQPTYSLERGTFFFFCFTLLLDCYCDESERIKNRNNVMVEADRQVGRPLFDKMKMTMSLLEQEVCQAACGSLLHHQRGLKSQCWINNLTRRKLKAHKFVGLRCM